jgi:hypothetical protein
VRTLSQLGTWNLELGRSTTSASPAAGEKWLIALTPPWLALIKKMTPEKPTSPLFLPLRSSMLLTIELQFSDAQPNVPHVNVVPLANASGLKGVEIPRKTSPRCKQSELC